MIAVELQKRSGLYSCKSVSILLSDFLHHVRKTPSVSVLWSVLNNSDMNGTIMVV